MATATIPLAKNYEPSKLTFPVYLSTKYDGVPVKISLNAAGNFTVRSRQNKTVYSVKMLVRDFVNAYIARAKVMGWPLPVTFVGEVIQAGKPYADFKDTGGIVRREYDQSGLLEIRIFETDFGNTFAERSDFMNQLFGMSNRVTPVSQARVEKEAELDKFFKVFTDAFPEAEGLVARSHNDPYSPGKRNWGYQKVLNEPTIDLKVVGFEEAVSQHGEPKGMVGRVIVSYRGEEIGCGPGKLTHKERTELWEWWSEYKDHEPVLTEAQKYKGRIAQIKYKPGGGYTKLRQPTFQYWRDDKDTPDA